MGVASGQLYMTGFVFPELEFEPRLYVVVMVSAP